MHFPPTPMEVDRIEPGWEVQGVHSLASSASVPNQLGKGRSSEHGISGLANGTSTRSASDTAGLRNGHTGAKERKRSRLSDGSSSDQNRVVSAGRRRGKERVRDRDRNRNGFEGLFEQDDSRRPDDDNGTFYISRQHGGSRKTDRQPASRFLQIRSKRCSPRSTSTTRCGLSPKQRLCQAVGKPSSPVQVPNLTVRDQEARSAQSGLTLIEYQRCLWQRLHHR